VGFGEVLGCGGNVEIKKKKGKGQRKAREQEGLAKKRSPYPV
jgi:hypothetical protein